MNALSRLLLCFAAVAALLAGLVSLQPNFFAGLGLDVWAVPDLHRQMQELGDEHAIMSRDDEALCRRLEHKQRIVAEVVDGGVSLDAAVARFRALNEEQPSAVAHTRRTHPAPTLEGSVCLQVLAWVRTEVERLGPERGPERLAVLEAESRRFLSAP